VIRKPILLALLAAGCAGLGAGRPPRSGAPWRELASEHFVVRTDLGAAGAAELIEQLEWMRAAVAAALYLGDREPPGRVEVIAFADPAEYEAFAPRNASAYYLRNAGGLPRLVMPGRLGAWQRVVLAHELAHHMMASLYVRQPRWLGEGMAAWLEGLAEGPSGPRVTLGRMPVARLPRVRQRQISARDLMAWGEGPLEGDWLDHYASALLVVRHLADRHPGQLRELLERLARGEPPGPAFRAALPEFDPERPGALEALDAAVAARVASGLDYRGREIEVRADLRREEQPMPPAEVAALRLTLWAQGPKKGREALRAEAQEVLRHDPAHPIGLQVNGELQGTEPLPLARASIAAHPDDPRAWSFLASALTREGDAAEREQALRRVAELAPDNALALANLAKELLARQRSGQALPLARRSALLAPWSPPIVELYASVLADLGQCSAALQAHRRAVDLVGERGLEAERAAMRRRLEEAERRCANGPMGNEPRVPGDP